MYYTKCLKLILILVIIIIKVLRKNLYNNPKRYLHINILHCRFTKSITIKNINTEINIWVRREKFIKDNLK